MSHIVLHNENNGEEFRYDVPQREAQALSDLMFGGGRMLRLSWSVAEASDDIAVSRATQREA